MKFKDLVKRVEEAVEIGKPETTKAYASMTPGQPDVVFTPPAEVDGVKIAAELDPAGGIEHNIKHALARKDKDEDGDVDTQDKHTPDEVTGDEKKNQTLHLLKKGAAERAHTKKGVAYEGYVATAPAPGDKWKDHAVMVKNTGKKQRVVILRKNIDNYPASDGWKEVRPGFKEEVELDEAMTPQQKSDFDRMMAGAMSRAAYNAKWKKPLKSDDKVIYGKNVKEESEIMVEKLSASDDMGKWIDDFQKSDAPQFAGKSKEERRKMAIAAKMSADRDAGVKEDLDYILEYPSDLAKMKKSDSYKVGDKIWTKVGGQWHKGHITTPLNKAGNHGVKFQHGGKTHSYVSSPNDLRLHVESVELDEASTYDKTSPASKPQHESVDHINESEDKTLSRLKQLVRFGLMDKSKLPLLSRAISSLEKGNVANPTERQVLFDLLNELIGVVTGDDAMFAKVRMSVQNEDLNVEE